MIQDIRYADMKTLKCMTVNKILSRLSIKRHIHLDIVLLNDNPFHLENNFLFIKSQHILEDRNSSGLTGLRHTLFTDK